MLHRLNLPAGTDVSRILNEIGQLRVQVRELSAELDEARAELAVASRRRPSRPDPQADPGQEAGGQAGGRGLMATVLTPGEVVERVRRDAERNVLRVRNGLKHLAGVGRPQLTQTPKETVWSAEKVELWHYPSDRVRYRTPLLFVHSLVSRSYVFDLVPGNSFVETMRDRGFDIYLVDWGVPDELESGNTLETYTDGYIPTIVAEVQRQSGRPDVNLFGYCFGGVLSLLSVAGNPECRSAAWP